MAYEHQTQDHRRTLSDPPRRDTELQQNPDGRTAGSIVVIVVVALIALGLLYWAATVMWAPATTTDITVTPAPTETVPAPAPDATVAPTEELAPPPAEAPAPAEPPTP